MRAVSRYDSSTSSTMRSGSGTRSSSTETVPVKPVSRIACRYSLIGVTPRPGGMSPCTLPSQSETCTCPIIPVSTATSSNDAPERCRCETSAFALTAGWSTSRIRSGELVHAVGDGVLERLELDHQLDSLRLGVLGELAEVLRDEPEDLLLREHLQVAVVLAGDEQHVAAAEVRLLVDVRLAAVEREAAHGGHEVDEAERDADGGADRQPELLAGLLDRAALVVARRQRVLEDVVASKPISFVFAIPSSTPSEVPCQAEPISPSSRAFAHQLGDVSGAGGGEVALFRRGGRAPSRSGCDPPGAGR